MQKWTAALGMFLSVGNQRVIRWLSDKTQEPTGIGDATPKPAPPGLSGLTKPKSRQALVTRFGFHDFNFGAQSDKTQEPTGIGDRYRAFVKLFPSGKSDKTQEPTGIGDLS